MDIDYVLPSPHLRAWFSVFGHVRGSGASTRPVVPALLPNLQIWLSACGRYDFGRNGNFPAPRVSLVGPTSAAFGVEVPAGFELVCVGFLPAGWHAVVADRPDILADSVLDATVVWPAGVVDRMWQAVAEQPTLAGRRDVLERFLLGRMTRPAGRRADYIRSVQDWLEGPGPLDLDDLRRRIDLSARQTGRVTLDLYGLSPKDLAMKYRALRAARLLVLGGPAAFDQAVADYADQSHLIRDLQRFVGFSPGQLLVGENVAARVMLRGRWQTGVASVTALLS